MQTEWKVEGRGAATKIIANCPACHTLRQFHGDPMKVVQEKFKHNLCNGLVESIPTEIRDQYWERAAVSQY